MNKPYEVSPYDVLKSKDCPWLADFTAKANQLIADYDSFIVKEANSDHCEDFANEEYLYHRFLDNKKYDLIFGNLVVLKYFHMFFEKKIIMNMIGKWMYNDYDVEMYKYFSNTVFGLTQPKVSKVLRSISKDYPQFFSDEDLSKWTMKTTVDGSTSTIKYVELFYDLLIFCSDMVRNAKGLEKYYCTKSLFDLPKFYSLYSYKDACFNDCTDITFT